MRIRVNEEAGVIEIEGVVISLAVLREIVNPDRRLLFRFEKKAESIQATCYSESQVIWLDRNDPGDSADIGAVQQKDGEKRT